MIITPKLFPYIRLKRFHNIPDLILTILVVR